MPFSTTWFGIVVDISLNNPLLKGWKKVWECNLLTCERYQCTPWDAVHFQYLP